MAKTVIKNTMLKSPLQLSYMHINVKLQEGMG